MFAKYLRTRHGVVLTGVISNSKNLVPLCWSHHKQIENRKKDRYERSGLAGVLGYIGSDYPRSDNPWLKAVHDRQVFDLFRRVARNIEETEVDSTADVSEDYKRALDIAREHIARLRPARLDLSTPA